MRRHSMRNRRQVSKAGRAALQRAENDRHSADPFEETTHEELSSSDVSETGGDAALARKLQEQFDRENAQCEHVSTLQFRQ